MATHPLLTTMDTVNGLVSRRAHDALWLTDAERTADLTPGNFAFTPDNMLRYLVPNVLAAAADNTAVMQETFDPLVPNGPKGRFYFPNTSGDDTYYFNDWIPFRDYIHLHLMGCRLKCTKSTLSAYDALAGFLMGIRGFVVEHGTVEVDYSGGGSSVANILIGARGSDTGAGAFYANSFDASLSVPQGDCHLKNLKLISNNNTGGLLVQLTGGLRNCSLKDITGDGGGDCDGIDYEFGWATSGTTNLRQTSHGSGLMFENIHLRNLGTNGTVLTLGGCYSATTTNIRGTGVASVITVTPGESLNYRPWVGEDQVGVKRNIHLYSSIGQSITSHGIQVAGAQLASGGYLSAIIAALGHPADYLAQTNLYDVVIDGFAFDGSGNPGNGYGIDISGEARISNGTLSGGFLRGINGTDEAVRSAIDNVKIFGCGEAGIYLDAGSAIWSPARNKMGVIRNCYIAGNSVNSAGAAPGIQINKCDNFLVENNRLGNELAYAAAAEATQGNGVQLGSGATNVRCIGNHVGGVVGGGSVGYFSGASNFSGNLIENASGVSTYTGLWEGVLIADDTITLTAATPGNLAVTYAARRMEYIKKGSLVIYSILVQTSAFTHSTASGNVRIGHMPLTINSLGGWIPISSFAFGGVTKANYTQFAPQAGPGLDYLTILASAQAQALTSVAITDLPTGGTIDFRMSGQFYV